MQRCTAAPSWITRTLGTEVFSFSKDSQAAGTADRLPSLEIADSGGVVDMTAEFDRQSHRFQLLRLENARVRAGGLLSSDL